MSSREKVTLWRRVYSNGDRSAWGIWPPSGGPLPSDCESEDFLPAFLLSEIADVATGCLTRASGELTEQQMVFFEPLQELLRDHSTPEGEPGLNEEVARWKRKWIPAVDTRDIDPTPEEEK